MAIGELTVNIGLSVQDIDAKVCANLLEIYLNTNTDAYLDIGEEKDGGVYIHLLHMPQEQRRQKPVMYRGNE